MTVGRETWVDRDPEEAAIPVVVDAVADVDERRREERAVIVDTDDPLCWAIRIRPSGRKAIAVGAGIPPAMTSCVKPLGSAETASGAAPFGIA